MAGLLARGSLPSAAFPGIPSGTGLGLVAYSCGGSAGVERTRTGFPFHLPRGRTIADDASRRGSRGQQVLPRGQPPLAACAENCRRNRRQPMTTPVRLNKNPKPHNVTINALRSAGRAFSAGRSIVCNAL
jgi:hypothetical protein